MPPRRIRILAFDGAQAIDIAGPLQAFATADEETGGRTYDLAVVSPAGTDVVLSGGLVVRPKRAERPAPDTLIVPGGPGVQEAKRDPAVSRLIARWRSARRVCSVCTGAFVLAEAGLLAGRRAVTHWRACARLAQDYPDVRVERDPIWTRDGRIWTSAGVTSGIDLSLKLIEDDLGAAVALRVARRLVVYMRRAGGQAQHSAPLALQSADAFAPVVDWLVANAHKPIKVDDLAARAGMAPRSFHRHFLARTGQTPAKAIEGVRLDQARGLMETTRLTMGAIAGKTGFGSEERLRRAFLRAFGVTPQHYRERFAPAS